MSSPQRKHYSNVSDETKLIESNEQTNLKQLKELIDVQKVSRAAV